MHKFRRLASSPRSSGRDPTLAILDIVRRDDGALKIYCGSFLFSADAEAATFKPFLQEIV